MPFALARLCVFAALRTSGEFDCMPNETYCCEDVILLMLRMVSFRTYKTVGIWKACQNSASRNICPVFCPHDVPSSSSLCADNSFDPARCSLHAAADKSCGDFISAILSYLLPSLRCTSACPTV